MSTVTQIHEGDIKYDLEINEGMPELYSDGISNLIMGNTVSKVTFHSVKASVPIVNGIEQRKGVLQLTIPTHVLLEMCRNILFSAQSSVNTLSEGGKHMDAQVRKILEGVSIVKLTAVEKNKK